VSLSFVCKKTVMARADFTRYVDDLVGGRMKRVLGPNQSLLMRYMEGHLERLKGTAVIPHFLEQEAPQRWLIQGKVINIITDIIEANEVTD